MSVLGLTVEKGSAPLWMRALLLLAALLIAFILTSGLVIWAGASPLEAFYYFLIDPLSSRTGVLETLLKATPLILTGVAVSFAFSAGYYNIGAEGQLYAGAVAAAWVGIRLAGLPTALGISLMLLFGFIAGVLWALIPALLRVRLAVDEVVTTLLLNSVMLFIVSALLNGPWRDPISSWPQSPDIAVAAQFPRLVARSRLHLGFLIALASVLVLWFVLSRTSLGLKMRSVGLGQEAARFAGVNVGRVMLIAALISGGIAGIAGVSEVAGMHYHLIGDISRGYGYTGIIVATLGGLNPLGVAAAGLFFGLLDTGAQSVSRALGVPVYLGEVAQATVLLVTLAIFPLRHYRIRRVL